MDKAEVVERERIPPLSSRRQRSRQTTSTPRSKRCGINGVNLGGNFLSCSGDDRITKLFLPTDQPILISVTPSVISFRTQALKEGLTDFANLAIVTN